MDNNDLVPPRISSIPITSSRVLPEPSSPIAAPQLTRRGHSDSASATLERQLRNTRQSEGISAGETWKDFLRGTGPDDELVQAESSRGASVSGARRDHFKRPVLPSSATSPVAAQQTEWSRAARDERWMDYMRRNDSQKPGKEKAMASPLSARSQSHSGIPGESGSRAGASTTGETSSERQRQKARMTLAHDELHNPSESKDKERPQPLSMTPFIPYRQDRQLNRKRNPSTEFPSTKRMFSGSPANITSPTSPVVAGTSSHPIDLTSPGYSGSTAFISQQPFRQQQSAGGHRRESSSSIVLPPWQPDDAVDRCTVCQTQFSFLFRRHHCRKCGRVVCANCSPHRITIPRQFIVQPPNASSASALGAFNTSPERGAAGFAARLAQELAGNQTPGPIDSAPYAEVVRVCNPCVPDPNFSPPPQTLPSEASLATSVPAFDLRASGRPDIPQRGASLSGHAPAPGIRQRLNSAYAAYQYLQQGVPPSVQPRSASIAAPRQYAVTGQAQPYNFPSPLQPQHRHSVATSTILHRRAPEARSSSLSQAPQAPRAPPPRRPPIKEEDECPVCGRELPPKGPIGDESAREQHVMECINSYSAPTHSASPVPPSSMTDGRIGSQAVGGASSSTQTSSTTSSSTPISVPSTIGTMQPPGPSTPFAASAAPPAPILAAPASSGPSSLPDASMARTPPAPIFRATPHPARMLVYHATEKDLVDPSTGEPQECVICFEEFEEGDELGRLECLCKFHRACIRGWWERKGRGACPTHQVGEYM